MMQASRQWGVEPGVPGACLIIVLHHTLDVRGSCLRPIRSPVSRIKTDVAQARTCLLLVCQDPGVAVHALHVYMGQASSCMIALSIDVDDQMVCISWMSWRQATDAPNCG